MEKEAEKPKTASFSLLQGEKMSTKFIASGDCFITRAVPENGYSGFTELKSLIESADVRFTNLEMTFHDQEGYPAAASGGTWACLIRECSMKSANMVSISSIPPTTTPETLVRKE